MGVLMAEGDKDDDQPAKSDEGSEENKKHSKKDEKEKDKKSDEADGSDDGDSDDGDDDKPKKPPLYKRPLFWIILAVVLAVLIVGGTLYYLHARQYVSTDDAFVDTHIVRLAPEVDGIIIDVPAEDNRHVEAGTLLAVIKPNGPEAQRAEAQAGIYQAIAQVKQAEAQVTSARAGYRQALAQIPGPEADAAKAARDLERYLALARIDAAAVAKTQIDQARAQAQSTAGTAAAARRQADQQATQIAVARKQVDAARAQVKAAQARVQQANVTINDLRITAPVSGQIANRSVNLGSYVSAGTQLMAIIPDKMWVTANFKETQLVHMQLGQHVALKIDAYPGIDFEGHVDSIARAAGQSFALLPPQNATGNYVKVVQRVPVRIVFDHLDPRLTIGPGMSVVPTVKVR